MGIPYSREINAAFEQVTPLVAAGFKVLKTTRNISILLAIIQVLTVALLAMILLVGMAVLYCVNPDLEVPSPLLLSLASFLSGYRILTKHIGRKKTTGNTHTEVVGQSFAPSRYQSYG
jgi:hypothetical protein